MARVRFLLKDPQHNVQGKKQSTLVLLVYRFPGNTRLVYSINESVSPDDWDFKAQEPKPTRNNTARRSFATNAHRAGIPPAIAMMFTGHKTIQQYMDYIMIVEDEAAEEYLNHPFFK
jgi:hypothetical protein